MRILIIHKGIWGDLDIGPIPETLPPKEKTVGGTVQCAELGLKRPTTIPSKMLEKLLMTLGEVDIGLGPAPLIPIIRVMMVYHLVFIVMVIT